MLTGEKGAISSSVTAAEGITDVANSVVLKQLTKPIKLPGERNPVLSPSRAFSSCWPDLSQSTVRMRDCANNVGCESVEHISTHTSCMGQTLKRAKLASCVISPDDMRLRSLSLIKIMLEADRTTTKLASSVECDATGPGSLSRSIRDALTGKSTATIYKRTQSMFGLFTWIRAKGDGSGLDLTEQRLYAYLCYMRDSNRGATPASIVLTYRRTSADLSAVAPSAAPATQNETEVLHKTSLRCSKFCTCRTEAAGVHSTHLSPDFPAPLWRCCKCCTCNAKMKLRLRSLPRKMRLRCSKCCTCHAK